MPPSKRARFFFIALIGSFMMLAALATDAMLPAFPLMAEHFGISEAAIQQVLSIFMLGFALPHIIIGSLADRFGRKPILFAGLGIYLAGSLLCLIAPNFVVLLVGRFIQGIGAAAGSILSRAILRDLFQGAQLGRYLSFVMVAFAAGPVLAPGIGAVILQVSSWPAIFAFLALFAILLLIWIVLALPETLKEPNPKALEARVFYLSARAILSHPQSGPIVGILSLIYGSLIAYLSSSPILFISFYQLSEAHFALLFAIIASTMFLSQPLNAHLLKRYSSEHLLRVALICHLFVTLILVLQIAGGIASITSLTLNFSAFFICFSFMIANGTALILDPHKERAGMASGLLGFIQIVVGTLLGSFIASFAKQGPLPLALGMSLIALITLSIFLLTRQKLKLALTRAK